MVGMNSLFCKNISFFSLALDLLQVLHYHVVFMKNAMVVAKSEKKNYALYYAWAHISSIKNKLSVKNVFFFLERCVSVVLSVKCYLYYEFNYLG